MQYHNEKIAIELATQCVSKKEPQQESKNIIMGIHAMFRTTFYKVVLFY